jgi:hypothetical protein
MSVKPLDWSITVHSLLQDYPALKISNTTSIIRVETLLRASAIDKVHFARPTSNSTVAVYLQDAGQISNVQQQKESMAWQSLHGVGIPHHPNFLYILWIRVLQEFSGVMPGSSRLSRTMERHPGTGEPHMLHIPSPLQAQFEGCQGVFGAFGGRFHVEWTFALQAIFPARDWWAKVHPAQGPR